MPSTKFIIFRCYCLTRSAPIKSKIKTLSEIFVDSILYAPHCIEEQDLFAYHVAVNSTTINVSPDIPNSVLNSASFEIVFTLVGGTPAMLPSIPRSASSGHHKNPDTLIYILRNVSGTFTIQIHLKIKYFANNISFSVVFQLLNQY